MQGKERGIGEKAAGKGGGRVRWWRRRWMRTRRKKVAECLPPFSFGLLALWPFAPLARWPFADKRRCDCRKRGKEKMEMEVEEEKEEEVEVVRAMVRK